MVRNVPIEKNKITRGTPSDRASTGDFFRPAYSNANISKEKRRIVSPAAMINETSLFFISQVRVTNLPLYKASRKKEQMTIAFIAIADGAGLVITGKKNNTIKAIQNTICNVVEDPIIR